MWRTRYSSSETGGRGEAEFHHEPKPRSYPVPEKEIKRSRKSGAVWNIYFGKKKEVNGCADSSVSTVVSSRVCFFQRKCNCRPERIFPSFFFFLHPPYFFFNFLFLFFFLLPFPLWKQRTLGSTLLSSRRETAWRPYLEVRFNNQNNPVKYDTRVGGNYIDRVAHCTQTSSALH